MLGVGCVLMLVCFLCSRADDRKLSVLMDLFDSNKDGTINYSEFLFMFVDRRDILRRWQASVATPGKEGAAAMVVAGPISCYTLCFIVQKFLSAHFPPCGQQEMHAREGLTDPGRIRGTQASLAPCPSSGRHAS